MVPTIPLTPFDEYRTHYVRIYTRARAREKTRARARAHIHSQAQIIAFGGNLYGTTNYK